MSSLIWHAWEVRHSFDTPNCLCLCRSTIPKKIEADTENIEAEEYPVYQDSLGLKPIPLSQYVYKLATT